MSFSVILVIKSHFMSTQGPPYRHNRFQLDSTATNNNTIMTFSAYWNTCRLTYRFLLIPQKQVRSSVYIHSLSAKVCVDL